EPRRKAVQRLRDDETRRDATVARLSQIATWLELERRVLHLHSPRGATGAPGSLGESARSKSLEARRPNLHPTAPTLARPVACEMTTRELHALRAVAAASAARRSRRSSGVRSPTHATVAMQAMPPLTTENAAPIQFATKPASISPSCGPPMKKII